MGPEELTVLVADDFAGVRVIVRQALKKMGIVNVIEAADGQEALNAIRFKKLDLIISDWNMPFISGLELLKEIRSDEKTSDIPFVMLTAEAESDAVITAIKSKVTQYIVKPFSQDTLVDKVVLALKAKKKKTTD